MNGKGVRSFWLNALIITTVLWIWLSIAGGLILGGVIAYELSSSDTPSYEYDSDYYDDNDE